MAGFFKVYRDLLHHRYFKNEKLFKVFMYCLMKATYIEFEEQVGLQKVPLLPGQFVFGRKKAAIELDMKESTIMDYMRLLKSDNTIDIQSTNKYSIVTVVNWQIYQSKEEATDNKIYAKSNNKATSEQQQSDSKATHTRKRKNDKKIKKEKKESQSTLQKLQYSENVYLTDEQYEKLIHLHGPLKLQMMIKKLSNHKCATGKNYKSDYHVLLESGWVNEWYEKQGKKESATVKGKIVNLMADPEMAAWLNAEEHL